MADNYSSHCLHAAIILDCIRDVASSLQVGFCRQQLWSITMVNIDTNFPKAFIPVTKTRKAAKVADAAVTRQQFSRSIESETERRDRRERRKFNQKTMLDLRSGRDRRRVRAGKGIDIKA